MIDTTIRLLPAAPSYPLLPATPSYSPLWCQRFERASKSKNPLKAATPQIFNERLKLAAPALWAGETGLQLSEDESDAILSELEKGVELCQQQIIQNAFRDGLGIGNQAERWQIAFPPLRLVVAHYANPIKPQHVVLLKPFHNIRQQFLAKLPAIFESTPAELAGAILFAAAAFDGLIDAKRAEALVKIDVTAISINRGVCLVDLGDAGTWFPGALSQALIFCYHRRFGLPLCADENSNQSAPAMPVKPRSHVDGLRALGQSLEKLTGTERTLLVERIPAICRAFHGTVFPGYLLSYVNGVNKSSSLPARRYQEIFTGQCDTLSIPSESATEALAADYRHHNKTHRERVMQAIRRHIKSLATTATAPPNEVKAAIAALIAPEDRWPIQKLLGEWVIAKIDETLKKDGAWTSLIRYYQALWWPLFIEAGEDDPCTMSATMLVNWIERALARHNTDSSQLYFQQQIGDFLRYLSSNHGVPKIDFADLEGWISDSICRVNSDWILPGEFDRVIELLRSDTIIKEPWLREVCVLVARICYRGGTRRLEPLQARVRDLQTSKTPELVIRESLLGTLKSDQGERRIPLLGLFPDTEPQELLAYHSRRTLVSKPDAPLFSSPNAPDEPLDHEKVYRYITKAMKIATGRDDVVVHLLRHGCANTRLLQLEIADGSIELPDGLDGLSHVEFSSQRCEAVKNALFQRRSDDSPDTGERNLFALALLLGHLSPATTMKSYQHMMDFLVHLHARAAQPAIRDYLAIAAAIGTRKSQIYNIAKKCNISAKELTLEGVLPEIQRRHSEGLTRSEVIDKATSRLPRDPSPPPSPTGEATTG